LNTKHFNQLLEGLRNLGCSYVVIDKDGADYTYGDAFKKGPGKKATSTVLAHCASTTARGSRTSNQGAAQRSRATSLTSSLFRQVSASMASDLWGNGSYMHTSRNREKNVLEVLRVL
jgi:hypothetical protein